jgi:hypothetical protein
MDLIRARWGPIDVLTLKSFNKRFLMTADEFCDGRPNGFSFALEPAA